VAAALLAVDCTGRLTRTRQAAATQNVGTGSNDGPADSLAGGLDGTACVDPDNGGVGLGDPVSWLGDGDGDGDGDSGSEPAGCSDPVAGSDAPGDSDPAGGSLPIGASDPVGGSPPWAGTAAAAADTPSPPADTANDRPANPSTRTPAMSDRFARTPAGSVHEKSSTPLSACVVRSSARSERP